MAKWWVEGLSHAYCTIWRVLAPEEARPYYHALHPKKHASHSHALAPEEAPPRDEVAVVADKECGDGAEQSLIYAQQDERRAKEPRGEDKEPRAQLALLVDVGL